MIDLGSIWGGFWVDVESICGQFVVDLGGLESVCNLIRDRFWVDLDRFGVDFCVDVGSIWEQFRIDLGSVFGVDLGSVCQKSKKSVEIRRNFVRKGIVRKGGPANMLHGTVCLSIGWHAFLTKYCV